MKTFSTPVPCSVCGILCRARYETETRQLGADGSTELVHSRVRNLCEACLAQIIEGRLLRVWVPLGEPTPAQLQWLEEAKALLGPKVDALKLGQHLLRLLPTGQALDDGQLLKAVDQFPFTKLGTAQTGTDYLDLSVLLRCWSRGLLLEAGRFECPSEAPK